MVITLQCLNKVLTCADNSVGGYNTNRGYPPSRGQLSNPEDHMIHSEISGMDSGLS